TTEGSCGPVLPSSSCLHPPALAIAKARHDEMVLKVRNFIRWLDGKGLPLPLPASIPLKPGQITPIFGCFRCGFAEGTEILLGRSHSHVRRRIQQVIERSCVYRCFYTVLIGRDRCISV